MCQSTWFSNENEAGVDLVSMLTSFLSYDIGYNERTIYLRIQVDRVHFLNFLLYY